MALVARGVDAGTGINVLADNGALGDMQIVKLGISALGNQGLIPATIADGILVQVSNPTAVGAAVTSVIPGTGATNLGKAEDAVAGSGDTGVSFLVVRADTAAASGANGDYVFPISDALGKLWTADVQTEDAVAASGDRGSFALAIQRTTRVSDAADGDYVGLHTDSLGQLWITGTQIEDAVAGSGDTGTFILGVRRDTPTSGAAAGDYHEIQVDAVGGVWLAGSQIEDAVAASGDRGLFALVIRRDTATADGANGDYVGLHVDALGKLRITGSYPEDSASADGQELIAVAAVRRDTQAVGSGTDGDISTINVDAFGRLRVADRNEVSVAATTALAASLVVKASAGKLFGFYGYSTVTQFIQLHNTTSVPADTAVPVGVFPITANTPFSLWLEHPQPCSTGITLCNSTTGPTKTIGASNTWITALYE